MPDWLSSLLSCYRLVFDFLIRFKVSENIPKVMVTHPQKGFAWSIETRYSLDSNIDMTTSANELTQSNELGQPENGPSRFV